jgi:hypothetical protein
MCSSIFHISHIIMYFDGLAFFQFMSNHINII